MTLAGLLTFLSVGVLEESILILGSSELAAERAGLTSMANPHPFTYSTTDKTSEISPRQNHVRQYLRHVAYRLL